MRGIVKWFNDSKGYGFIAGEDGKDYFVHHAEILMGGRRTLAEGQGVKFEGGEGPKGIKAVAVIPEEA